MIMSLGNIRIETQTTVKIEWLDIRSLYWRL